MVRGREGRQHRGRYWHSRHHFLISCVVLAGHRGRLMPGYCSLCSLTEHSESAALVLLECRNSSEPDFGREEGGSVHGISNRQTIEPRLYGENIAVNKRP